MLRGMPQVRESVFNFCGKAKINTQIGFTRAKSKNKHANWISVREK